MKIVALKERADHEARVAISPETAKMFVKQGFTVFVEKGLGERAGFLDTAYADSGAQLSNIPLEIISDADIILKVQPSRILDNINEIDLAKQGAIIIGLLSIYNNRDYLLKLSERKLSACAMELIPRITKAQSMDVLSSQSNLAGYRAVIEASYHLNKAFPMMMTAAGTVFAAKVLILGVGVAGLQAIATAKRLGAIVAAYDIRKAAKEQVESLGAKFISDDSMNDMEDKSGYAKEASEDLKLRQEKFLLSVLKSYDIIITTAQIPNKKAPVLITEHMLQSMKHGCVLVDMAIASGGNVAGAKMNEVLVKNGVTILAPANLASLVPADSSKLYAKNLYNFVMYAVKNKTDSNDKFFDFDDEIVKQLTLIRDGSIINDQLTT